MQPKALQWTTPEAPNEDIRYDHVTAETPFGRALITWKSWKDYPSYCIDETPWGDFFECGNNLDEAKAMVEAEYQKRLMDCIAV